MKKAKKHQPMPKVNMKTLAIAGKEYLLIQVRKDAIDFVVDNAMQYLVYKVPAYENWCNNDILEDFVKLNEYLDKYENSEQWKNSGCKLPDGKWNSLGKADKNGFDNYVKQVQMNPETTLVLRLLTSEQKDERSVARNDAKQK